MTKLNDAGLPQFFDLIPPSDQVNAERRLNLDLKTLMAVLQSQGDALGANIDALYDSWFIETCPSWAVSYIAKLVDQNNPYLAPMDIPEHRALVANTTSQRSHRGITRTLALVSQDASGCACIAMEGFQHTAITDRMHNGLKSVPFTVDITDKTITNSPIYSGTSTLRLSKGGPLHIPVAHPEVTTLYLWQMRTQFLRGVTCFKKDGPEGLYSFDPIGRDLPLYLQISPSDPNAAHDASRAFGVPLKRYWLRQLMANTPELLPFQLYVGGSRIGIDQLLVDDLSSPGKVTPVKDKIIVDPECGRLLSGLEDQTAEVSVDVTLGLLKGMGGGAYDRSQRMAIADGDTIRLLVQQSEVNPKCIDLYDQIHTGLQEALNAIEAWPQDGGSKDFLIEIGDSRTYHIDGFIAMPAGGNWVAIQAISDVRPCIVCQTDQLNIAGKALYQKLWLSGLLLQAPIALIGDLDLTLVDCTVDHATMTELPCSIIRERPDIARHTAQDSNGLRLTFSHCLLGPVHMHHQDLSFAFTDCIIQGQHTSALSGLPTTMPTPAGVIENTTIIGDINIVSTTGISNLLLIGQIGNLDDSQETTLETEHIYQTKGLYFYGLSPTDPRYALPYMGQDEYLMTGASNGSEFGAYHSLYRYKRLEAARTELHDYTPADVTVDFRLMD